MGSNPPPPSHGRDDRGWEPGAGPTPEILPPDAYVPPPSPEYQYAPPPPQPRRQRSRWSVAPGTYVLLGINIAVFLLMVMGGVSAIKPTSESLMGWGANNAGSVLVDGQWWRIVTAMFVHGGILHLGLNMWCLWNLGMLAEPLMGTFGVFAVYLLTGAAGNMLSTLHNWIKYAPKPPLPPSVPEWLALFLNWIGYAPATPLPPDVPAWLAFPAGVGASGAIFGIAGALIVLLKSQRLPVPPEELKKIRRSVIYFAAINLFIGFSLNFGSSRTGVAIDNWAHLGGCASGLLFAVPMVPRIGSPRKTFSARLRIAVGMVAGILVLFGFFLAQLGR
jgi:rhomboid protease GluP